MNSTWLEPTSIICGRWDFKFAEGLSCEDWNIKLEFAFVKISSFLLNFDDLRDSCRFFKVF